MDFKSIGLNIVARILNWVIWKNPKVRQDLQDLSINVVPCNFYSDIPSIREVKESFEYNGKNDPVYGNVFDDELIQKYVELLHPYSLDFDPPMRGDIDDPKEFFWVNPAFSRLDAVSYYSMIRHFKPKKILEIGSGFSTLVADRAIKDNGFGEIVCIEPFPMPFLKNTDSVSNVIETKVQDIPLDDVVTLVEDCDIWFIDSTHTVKVGSDCLYIYLKVMPEITTKTVVHSHDIYLPFGFDKKSVIEKHIYWTEQYLLYAFLLGNDNSKVIMGSSYLYYLQRELAEKLLNDRGIGCGGASLWYSLNMPHEQSL